MVQGRPERRSPGRREHRAPSRDRGRRLSGASLRRLFPDPGETTIAEAIGSLDLVGSAPRDRPYLVTNFALTLDGRATIGGRAGPIGSPADLELLQRLRTRGDAVMVGAGTLRVERYGRMVPDEEFRRLREDDGLAPDPLGIVVSGRMDLPWDAGLFTCGEGEVLIVTETDAEPPETPTPLSVIRHDELDLGAALRELRSERGIRAVVCEGGPILHGQLVAAGLVDELFVTIAPKLAGPGAPGLVESALDGIPDLELVTLHESAGELYTRWRARR